MTMLVTLAQVKQHCRITFSTEDEDIVAKIEDASAAVLSYLGGQVQFIDSTGLPDLEAMPRQVRQATLRLVEWFYTERGGDMTAAGNYLPADVQALLYPLRDPVAV